MSDKITVLGEAQRGSVWRSSLNGALYRWKSDGVPEWQVKTSVSDWHALRPWNPVQEVHAMAGEKFVLEGEA